MAKNNEENNEENNDVKKAINSVATTASTLRKHFKRSFMFILIIVVAVILVIAILAAVIKDIIRLGAVKNSNDSSDSNYREYGPGAYSDSVTISTDDVENDVISFGMSVEEMWENDDRYSEYLYSVDELEYLLNAEFVTQYPYIASAGEDEINGTIRFYRNDSEDEMVYVSYDTLESYINSYNEGDTSVLDTALNSFTLNVDGSIMIAYLTEESYSVETNDAGTADSALEQISGSSMSQDEDGIYTVSSSSSILKTKNISYLSYVQKYTLPFNLLWSIVVMGHSNQEAAIDLAMSIADMAYEGEISLIIDDNNIYRKDTDTYTYNLTDHYNGTVTSSVTGTYTKQVININGMVTSSSSRVLNMSDYDGGTTITDYTIDTSCYATYIETHNENSPTIVIKRIEAWCAIFENDATYEWSSNSNADSPNGSTMDDSEEVHIADLSVDEALEVPIPDLVDWKNEYDLRFTDTATSETDSLTGITTAETWHYETHYEGTIEQTQNYTSIRITSVSSSRTTGYTNGTVTSPVFNEEIAEKFNDPNVVKVRSTICDADDDGWFIPALEVNEDTANLVDLMKYIINVANGDENDTDWETIWEGIYSSYSSISGGTSGISGNVGIIFDYLLGKGISAQGAAAVLGNFAQESGCMPNNLQNTFNTSLGMTDEEYTSAVNSGSYSKDSFVHDSGGYGIAQWTYYTRKQALYEFAQSYSDTFDISNIYMQLDFFWQELTTSYTAAYNAIKDATDVATATRTFCNLYEGAGIPNMENRIALAEQYYNEYLENGTVGVTGDIVSAAVSVHQYLRLNGYEYSQAGITVPNYSGRTIDCSSYVTWVLVQAGVDGFTSGMYQWNSATFRNNPYGWEEVSVDEAQPGDILCYDGHVEIVADASSNSTKFIVYNCGSDNAINAAGTDTLPESSTSGYAKSKVLKVLRVTTN